ncbi:MAG: DUF4157 domain-containing protein [Bacteroidota bacterium]
MKDKHPDHQARSFTAAAQRQSSKGVSQRPPDNGMTFTRDLAANQSSIQMVEEEDMLQGKFSAQMMNEEEMLQGKFTSQLMEEEEMMQGKIEPVQRQANHEGGMPPQVQTKMESALDADFSDVKIHANSAKAPEVGALAYTQGSDIHFAPGQFKPQTSAGQQLLGHELTHVVQQREGRVQPTTEIGGMPVNDDPSLEKEADDKGNQAAR